MHYEERESRKSLLLTGLPVGRAEGVKVLSARFVFQVYLNWYEKKSLIKLKNHSFYVAVILQIKGFSFPSLK